MVQKSQFSSDAAKFSSLGLVWAVVAAAAYVLLPWITGLDNQQVKGWEYTYKIATQGLAAFQKGQSASLSDPGTLIYLVLILFIPVAIVAVFLTSLAMRGHVLRIGVVRLYILFGLVGLVATIALFVPYVLEEPKNQVNFAIAAAVVVATAVVTRVQKWLRNLFKNNPAVASIGLLVVAYATIWLASQGSFTTTILTQIGIWLTLTAFIIVVWSGITLRREAIRARRAGPR